VHKELDQKTQSKGIMWETGNLSTTNLPGGENAAGVWSLLPHRHQFSECLENVGQSASHSPIVLQSLLQG
jgi:hypothetical protein